MSSYIKIRGAKAHNLQGVDVDIPRRKFVVVTGLSGSGKSSLAFDTLYAEGQRRYMDTLSTYAKHFMGILEKPEVESITGSPKSSTSCACCSPKPPQPTRPKADRPWCATPTSRSST